MCLFTGDLSHMIWSKGQATVDECFFLWVFFCLCWNRVNVFLSFVSICRFDNGVDHLYLCTLVLQKLWPSPLLRVTVLFLLWCYVITVPGDEEVTFTIRMKHRYHIFSTVWVMLFLPLTSWSLKGWMFPRHTIFLWYVASCKPLSLKWWNIASIKKENNCENCVCVFIFECISLLLFATLWCFWWNVHSHACMHAQTNRDTYRLILKHTKDCLQFWMDRLRKKKFIEKMVWKKSLYTCLTPTPTPPNMLHKSKKVFFNCNFWFTWGISLWPKP